MEIEGTSARRKVRFHALVTRVVTGPKHSNTFGECSIVGVEANGMAAFLQATRIQRLALIGWEIRQRYCMQVHTVTYRLPLTVSISELYQRHGMNAG